MSGNQPQNQIEVAGQLMPAFKDAKLVRENIKLFRKFQRELLDPEVDIEMIQGRPFTKKSGWNVLNGFFGVTTKPIDSWRKELPDGEFMIVVVIEASAAGRESVARSGYCSSIEMKKKHGNKDYASIESHCHGMAETRGVGRASGAFYMVEDVSAEEIADAPTHFSDQNTTAPQKPKEKACTCMRERMKLAEDKIHCTNCNGTMTEAQKKLIAS